MAFDKFPPTFLKAFFHLLKTAFIDLEDMAGSTFFFQHLLPVFKIPCLERFAHGLCENVGTAAQFFEMIPIRGCKRNGERRGLGGVGGSHGASRQKRTDKRCRKM